ncbi:hypothetical protein [Formosa sp. A9]
MNVTSNLPEEPAFVESKWQQSLDNTVNFVRSLMYLVKKVFML